MTTSRSLLAATMATILIVAAVVAARPEPATGLPVVVERASTLDLAAAESAPSEPGREVVPAPAKVDIVPGLSTVSVRHREASRARDPRHVVRPPAPRRSSVARELGTVVFEVVDAGGEPLRDFQWTVETLGSKPTRGDVERGSRVSAPAPFGMHFNLRIDKAGYRRTYLRQVRLSKTEPSQVHRIKVESVSER